MMIHASIPADEPERVARVIAELWRGRSAALPFAPGAYAAIAGDDRGTTIEVGPRGLDFVPGKEHVESRPDPSPAFNGGVHLNIASPLTEAEIMAIAKREGWIALACDRGGVFKLIEFWLENKFMLEVMNDHEWERYKKIWAGPHAARGA
jgi:hypothetical protein